jgi:predicted Zn-dependent protease
LLTIATCETIKLSMRVLSICALLLALSILAFAQTPSPTPDIPAWTPPAPREKAWTLFAPKPITGDNIFRGEAETWLADAIVNVEGVSLDPINDKAVSDYVSQVGLNLVKYSTAPKKQYQFIVLKNDEEDAFSVGAGRIYINLGVLQSAQSEDELASVIAHEIGHDAFEHPSKTVTRQMFWMTGTRHVKSEAEVEKALSDLLAAYEKNAFATIGETLLGWSRANELEADKAGFYNVYKAGYNPEAMKNVFRRFVERSKKKAGDGYTSEYFFELLFGSHPPSSQRVTALKWESNWIKMPPKESQYKNAAFDAMKLRVKGL